MTESTELPLQGGCMCEGVRFEVSERPPGFAVCHCRRCQRRTGTASSMSAPVNPGAVTITLGAELVKWYDPGDGGFSKAFCTNCGSALFTRPPGNSDTRAIRMGSFDDDFGAQPAFHQFVDYAPAWAPVPDDGLPRFAERAPATGAK